MANNLKKVQSEQRNPQDFICVMTFLEEHPELCNKVRGINDLSEEYYEWAFKRFMNDRASKPTPSNSSPSINDPAIPIIMEIYYKVDRSRIETVQKDHKNAMSSENFVGKILEKYIDSIVKKYGWVHCSGDLVKGVDFIRKTDDGWNMVQVKNRTTSENSSSSKIRNDTKIEKWCRLNSYNGTTNWDSFPGGESYEISEEGFQNYLVNHLRA